MFHKNKIALARFSLSALVRYTMIMTSTTPGVDSMFAFCLNLDNPIRPGVLDLWVTRVFFYTLNCHNPTNNPKQLKTTSVEVVL